MNLKCKQEVALLGNEIACNEAITYEREHGTRHIEVQIGQSNEIFKDFAIEQAIVIGKTPYSRNDYFLLFV